jgi:coatomer protein complex subunit epsilon
MDSFTDSGELYTIRNQFYTNQHAKVRAYDLGLFSPENQLKVLEYQIRSSIALGEDASELIVSGRSKFPDNESFFQLLSAWDDLKSFGTDDSTYFDDIDVAEFELQAVLTTIYLVKFGKDIDQAIKFMTSYIDNTNALAKYNELEPFLVLVQLHLIQGNLTAANKIFASLGKFPDSTRDSIIYQVLESWLLSVKGETENINNSYYFYDELLSSDFDNDSQGKLKILNILFVLTLQLKHIPEAQELYTQIKALEEKPNGDFIANLVTYDYMINGGKNVNELIDELKSHDPEHEFLSDWQEKNDRFDEIVVKFKN